MQWNHNYMSWYPWKENTSCVSRCGPVPQHKFYKSQPNNRYYWKQLYRYVHFNSWSSQLNMIQEGREKGLTKSIQTPSVHQPKQAVTLRKYMLLMLDEQAFPSSPPLPKTGRWASLTLAHPLCDSHLAGGQRLHLESIISVLGCCTESLKKRKNR